MPSKKILEQKQQVVTELVQQMQGATAGVFVDYKGITVEQDTRLRSQLRQAGVEYSVVKNTLTRLAAREIGLQGLDEVLNGTTSMAVSKNDPVAAAKILAEFSEKNKCLHVKAGFLDGRVISAAEVDALAKLPNREGLLSMLCSALQGNIRGLAVALNAIVEKNGGATAEAAAPAAE